ncbi:MAG TPA: DUF2568 domain-containing protein [Actinomycetes bacterium]|nr:DUF2568 domain-containing protein [Actinomycetes bacterium]
MTGRGSGVEGRGGTAGSPPPELPAWQLGLRFCLELAALVAWGLAGWELTGDTWGGWLRWLVALALVSAAAGAWGTFRVEGDSGGEAKEPPVRVPGTVRLVVELVVLLGGAVAVTWAGVTVFGVVLGVLVVLHYATTMPRTTWLVAQ